jgi:tetratricopeptide (TPR) repeat protein
MGNFFSFLFSSRKNGERCTEAEKSEEINKEDFKKFDILRFDGIRARQMQQFSYAVKCFTEALKIRKDIEVMSFLTSSLVMMNELDKALDVLNEMLELEENNTTFLLNRANLLLQSDKKAEAVQDCLRIIETEPDNHSACFLLAKAEYGLGNRDKSIEAVSKAIETKGNFTDAYLLRAEIHFSSGEEGKALEDLEQVIRLAPREETAYLLRGRVREQMGELFLAGEDYSEALELNPFHKGGYLLAGKLLSKQKRYDEAIALLDEAIEHIEDFAEAYAERANAKKANGDEEGAAEDMQNFVKLEKEH